MAKIQALPGLDIISGFKGTIDYYVYMGQPCARAWPRSPGKRRSPAVETQWPAFRRASRLWNQLTPIVREAYKKMGSGTSLSGRDLFTKSYIGGIYRYPH